MQFLHKLPAWWWEGSKGEPERGTCSFPEHLPQWHRWANSFRGSFTTSTSSIMQAADSRWKLWLFSFHYTEALLSLSWQKRHEDDDRQTISKSLPVTAIKTQPHSCFLPLSAYKLLSDHLMSLSGSPAEEHLPQCHIAQNCPDLLQSLPGSAPGDSSAVPPAIPSEWQGLSDTPMGPALLIPCQYRSSCFLHVHRVNTKGATSEAAS